MMSDTDAMRDDIEDTRRETNQHLDAARAARTMEDMRVEMNRHRDGMTPMMFDIDMAMEGMASHCGGDGLDDMREIHGDLDGEMAQHQASIDAIIDLAAGLIETERHTTTMMATMEAMEGAMEQMRCR